MKKLLALVLCIVMVLSLSATAFAGDAGTASTASGISLYPVVKQANHFYGSLTKYDIMNKVAGLFKGFSTSYSTLLKNSTDAKAALNKLVEIFNAVNSTGFDDENTGKLKEIQYPNGTSLGYALAQAATLSPRFGGVSATLSLAATFPMLATRTLSLPLPAPSLARSPLRSRRSPPSPLPLPSRLTTDLQRT